VARVWGRGIESELRGLKVRSRAFFTLDKYRSGLPTRDSLVTRSSRLLGVRAAGVEKQRDTSRTEFNCLSSAAKSGARADLRHGGPGDTGVEGILALGSSCGPTGGIQLHGDIGQICPGWAVDGCADRRGCSSYSVTGSFSHL